LLLSTLLTGLLLAALLLAGLLVWVVLLLLAGILLARVILLLRHRVSLLGEKAPGDDNAAKEHTFHSRKPIYTRL
jgi:UDP-N-acetylmuramyl pentapeptide phosphotransferase/UDP-N-acetylglucosamine-1-phosphate transferase